MQTTTNYGLRKPEGTDVADIDDLNYNMDVLDVELKKKLDGEGTVTDYDEAIAMTTVGKVPDCTIIGRLYRNFLAGCRAIARAITGGRDGQGTGGVTTADTASPTTMAANITEMAIKNYNDGLNAATGTTPTVTHVWDPASPSAGAAANIQAKVTSEGYVGAGTVLTQTAAGTNGTAIAVSGGTGEEIVDIIPGVYRKIKINRTAAYEAGNNAAKVGTAAQGDVLEGKTFTNEDGVGLPGSMPNRGAVSQTITPGIVAQEYTIPAGKHDGNGKVNVPAVSAKKTLAANQTGTNVDMGGAYRYVNAEAVYNAGAASVKVDRKLTLTASQTGNNVDIADSWYTTCDASAVYNAGTKVYNIASIVSLYNGANEQRADGSSSSRPAGGTINTYTFTKAYKYIALVYDGGGYFTMSAGTLVGDIITTAAPGGLVGGHTVLYKDVPAGAVATLKYDSSAWTWYENYSRWAFHWSAAIGHLKTQGE